MDKTDEEIAHEVLAALWLAERRVAQLSNWRGSAWAERKIGKIRRTVRKAFIGLDCRHDCPIHGKTK